MIGPCSACDYWRAYRHDAHRGICRRFPPVMVRPGLNTLWEQPETGKYQACGEFKPKQTKGAK